MQDHDLDRFLNRFFSAKEPLIIGLICGVSKGSTFNQGSPWCMRDHDLILYIVSMMWDCTPRVQFYSISLYDYVIKTVSLKQSLFLYTININILLSMLCIQDPVPDTERRRGIGCLISIGFFPQKSH